VQRVYRRADWHAAKKNAVRRFFRAMNWVFLSHTVNDPCNTVSQCALTIEKLQNEALKDGFEDIYFNFLIGGDGEITDLRK
jgi:hypothetical protein